MLQAVCDIAKFLKNVAQAPSMGFSVELEFKRLNAADTRPGALFSARV
jgi:hypothetical protein